MDALDLFAAGERKITKRVHQDRKTDVAIEEIVNNGRWHLIPIMFKLSVPDSLISRADVEEVKRFVHEALEEREKKEQKTKTTSVYWPPPYNKFGQGFSKEDDVEPYLRRVQGIQNLLKRGQPAEDTIEIYVEDKVIQNTHQSGYERKRAKAKRRENRDCFLHYTIISYMGYFKAVKKEKGDADKAIAAQLEIIIEEARRLAYDTIKEAVQLYNRSLDRDKIESLCAEDGMVYDISQKTIEEISNAFAEHFASPTERLNYFNAMLQDRVTDKTGRIIKYGMQDVLNELEARTELKDSASRIPEFFREMVDKAG